MRSLPARRWALRCPARPLVALAGAGLLLGLAIAAPSASAAPAQGYHAGRDSATLTVTGVLDANCPVSTGGTDIWIKPGDGIDFDSSLAGVNVAGLPLHVGQLAGLDLSATIDGGTSSAQTFTVAGGSKTAFPLPSGHPLGAGDHPMTWTATGVALVGGLVVLPLSSAALDAGASLTWHGLVHVTTDAAQCGVAVAAPQVGVSAGPVAVTVPPVNISLKPSVAGQPPAGSPAGGSSAQPPASASSNSTRSGSSASGASGPTAGGGAAPRGGSLLGQQGVNGKIGDSERTSAGSRPGDGSVALASGGPAPYPFVLAIAAVVGLAAVSAAYARRRLI